VLESEEQQNYALEVKMAVIEERLVKLFLKVLGSNPIVSKKTIIYSKDKRSIKKR